ncbi:MAG TPA: YbaB/EbfC family nucleoid-associated protein [Candidatus Binataceae bacterium]|nr:YbaB/EbfC family nucleoid-associated protein [Candidatus Binataceae bacterium]
MAEINISELFQQAQQLQEKLKTVQDEAATKTVEAESGGGMVKVIADGSMRVRRITVEPSLLAAGDKPMLEDLIVVAVNDALARAQQLMAEAMGKLGPMAGMKIPGLGGD